MTKGGTRQWLADNQASLVAELERVRRLLASYAGEAAADAPLPQSASPSSPTALDHLVDRFGLSQFERDILLLCAGMEMDARFAKTCRAANEGAGPSFSLALAALPQPHWSAMAPDAPLRLWRMVELRPGEGLVTTPLRIGERVLHHLAGIASLDERLLGMVEPCRNLGSLSSAHEAVAAQMAARWHASPPPWPALQLLGAEAAEMAAVAGTACTARGLALCTLRAADIPASVNERQIFIRLCEREMALTDSALLLTLAEADSQETTRSAAAFAERAQCPLILAGRDPLLVAGRPIPRFELHKPPATEQAELWRAGSAVNGEVFAGHIDRLVNQFNLSSGAIVTATASLRRSGETDPERLGQLAWQTCREQARTRLDDLAQRVEMDASWDDLVLPEAQKQILRDIVVHVRQRGQVYQAWGFAAKGQRGLGISALFAGVSGTGKTLAAEIMAHELKLDLYKIDLSQVVSKYIGETEKNLRRVFDAAEAAGAVLLFDEADALFGKRSEVKDSHDRYANIEVSYLLQRMEAYRGLAILTTNMKQALDPAFARRIRFVIQFPFPDADQRAEIWQRVFPAQTPTRELDLGLLAKLHVAGGNIRNIAMGAAFLAADEQRPVDMGHLLRMARAEYAKLERPLTDGEIRGWA